jgi:tetratricopeptide (TPR) repeat protein
VEGAAKLPHTTDFTRTRMRSWFVPLVICLVAVACPQPALAQGGGAEAREVRAQQLLIAGMTRAYTGDHQAAIALYQQALELRPGESAILAALAEAHEERGDLSAALFHAEQAVAAAPGEPSVYRHLANLRAQTGDAMGAIDILREFVALSPQDPRALVELATRQQQAGMFEDALRTYERVLDAAGESATVRARMLLIYQRTGDLEGALGAVRALIEQEPRTPAHYEQLVEIGAALERSDIVMEALERLVELEPSNSLARLALIELYRERGDESSASALLAEAASLEAAPRDDLESAATLYARSAEDPRAARAAREILERIAATDHVPVAALLMLGDLRFRDGDYPGVVEVLAPALISDPGHPGAWLHLAAAHLELGAPGTAVEVVEEALVLFPGQYPLLRISTYALMQMGENARAVRRGEEALAIIDEERPEAHDERVEILAALALLQMRLGDHVRSDQLHEDVLALNPRHAVVLNNFAYDLANRGERLDEALEMARSAVDLEPQNASFLDTLGWVHHVRAEHDEAILWLSRAVDTANALSKSSAVYYEHLGRAQEAAGAIDAAIRSWERALELEPNRGHLRTRIEELR